MYHNPDNYDMALGAIKKLSGLSRLEYLRAFGNQISSVAPLKTLVNLNSLNIGGNKLTKMSPTRGFSIELGAAITVLLASRLSLPVSTTQCLTGAAMGVALMNLDAGALNWKAMAWIFGGWVFTLPCAGLIAGLLMLMSLNTPHF